MLHSIHACRPLTAVSLVVGLCLTGGAAALADTGTPAPSTPVVQAQDAGPQWAITPDKGSAAGGTKVTLTPPEKNSGRFTQASASEGHSMAIGADGNLYTWGDNGAGQLGRDTGDERQDPTPGIVAKPAGVDKWIQISTGALLSMAIGSDGNLYTWGQDDGNMGHDDDTAPDDRPSKVTKPAGVDKWIQASAGSMHSMAIGSDGNLYTWGYDGNLGRDDDTTPDDRPGVVTKPAGVDKWTEISTEDYACLALGSDGNIYSWGNNYYGELGRDDDTTPYERPGKVTEPAGVDKWTRISAGYDHSMAIGSDGNLYTWGSNEYGQLGRDTGDERNNPTPGIVTKPTGVDKWTQFGAGGENSLAIGSDGNLYTWGDNGSGELGRDTGDERYNPTPGIVTKPASIDKWTQIGARYETGMAIGSNGYLYTWGDNGSGQLGRDTGRTDKNIGQVSPHEVRLTGVRFGQDAGTDLAANADGTWSVTTPAHAAGEVTVTVSWSLNGVAQPDQHLTYTYEAAPVVTRTVTFDPAGGTPVPAQQITDGQKALKPADPTRDGHRFDGWYNGTDAYDFDQPVTHDLTLTAHWTRTTNPQWTITPDKGSATGGTKVILTPPEKNSGRFTQASASEEHSMAIGADGNLYTWGDNNDGHLGRDTGDERYDPTPGMVTKPAGVDKWTQISTDREFSMAIGSDGNLYTWGNNSSNELGRDTGEEGYDPTPGMVAKPAGIDKWTQASAGDVHSIALGSDGNIYTWGYNGYGQLGRDTGSEKQDATPGMVGKPAGVDKWTQISAGEYYSMAIGSDGNLYTWGDNVSGQLGRNVHTTPYDRPGTVAKPAGVDKWTQISAGYEHSMAIGSDGNLYTWGDNGSGQLGRDTGGDNRDGIPAMVAKPAGVDKWTQADGRDNNSLAIGSDGNLYSWGDNYDGQLGRPIEDVRDGTPGMVAKPAGIGKWTQASTGDVYSMAIGSNGNLYTWGSNSGGQLGRPFDNADKGIEQVSPHEVALTGVRFGQDAGTGLAANADGTWTVTTPAHEAGEVTVTVSWSLNGVAQPDQHLTYTYEAAPVVTRTVTFDPAGGTPVPAQQITDGQKALKPADPTRDGHRFDGWYNGTDAYDFDQPVTHDLTLTAHWTRTTTPAGPTPGTTKPTPGTTGPTPGTAKPTRKPAKPTPGAAKPTPGTTGNGPDPSGGALSNTGSSTTTILATAILALTTGATLLAGTTIRRRETTHHTPTK